jgi:N-sulfoglucosamine sulfohydrolase
MIFFERMSMTRSSRSVLRLAATTLLPLLVFSVADRAVISAQTKSPSVARPNIVLFVADDLGVTDIGAYGARRVRTPNLDRLAAQSMRFDRAYAGSPTCVPSRATLYTGLMPFRNGAHPNHSQSREGVKSLAHYFQRLGYTVAQAGKRHFNPPSVFPFEVIKGSEVPEPGFENKQALRVDLNTAPVDQWLASGDKAKPFFLIVADHSPHVIWQYKAEYKPEDVEIPPNHTDTPETRAARARYYTDITKMDRNVGQTLASLEKNGLAENTIFIFTSDQGPQWPFAKWTVYDAGIRAPLLIRWPNLVKAGGATDAMVSLADVVPTLVEAAGGKPPEGLDGQSFLKVLQGRTGVHREYIFATHTGDGQWNRNPARCIRSGRYKLILNLAPEITYTTHMDLAKDHDGGREYWPSWEERAKTDRRAAAVIDRYRNHPKEEFYDLLTDPYEIHNLIGDQKYADIVADLRTRLAEWRKQQGDDKTGPDSAASVK